MGAEGLDTLFCFCPEQRKKSDGPHPRSGPGRAAPWDGPLGVLPCGEGLSPGTGGDCGHVTRRKKKIGMTGQPYWEETCIISRTGLVCMGLAWLTCCSAAWADSASAFNYRT
jgi:hypothetical protein